jgi:hypothetical protein
MHIDDPPMLLNCSFSEDGSYTEMVFDSFGNRNDWGQPFQCSNLFDFETSENAKCVWSATSPSIRIYTSLSSVLFVGDIITLRGGVLKSYCPRYASVAECILWPTSSLQVCIIRAPTNAIPPVVSISAPDAINECEGFVLDISSSSGHGGRSWAFHSVNVSLTSGVDEAKDGLKGLISFYEDMLTTRPHAPLPAGFLKSNSTYHFHVILCNFLNQCGEGFHRLSVFCEAAPVVSILGSSLVNIYAFQQLVVDARAFYMSCTSQKSTFGLSHSWTMWGNGNVITGIKSASEMSSRFTVAANTLSVGTIYTFRVAVVHEFSKKEAVAEVKIQVVPSPARVVGVITGGSDQSFRSNGELIIDGSGSYNRDNATVTGAAAGLTYNWNCAPYSSSTAIAVGKVCNVKLTYPGNTKEIVRVEAGSDAVGGSRRLRVTMTVANSNGDKSSVGRDVYVLPELRSVAKIVSVTSPVVHTSKIKIFATVDLVAADVLAWTIDDASVDLDRVALTPTSISRPSGAHSANLVLSAGSLYAGSSYLLTLRGTGVSASVNVVIQGPPIPGSFHVNPSNGTELVDVFSFQTDFWSDTELPITYVFVFDARGAGEEKGSVIQSRSQLNIAETVLPAGAESALYMVDCIVRAFNPLDASDYLVANVQVSPSPSIDSAAVLALMSDRLISADSDFAVKMNYDSANQVVGVVSTVIRRSTCGKAPNCGSLNRAECTDVLDTCGECKATHVGIDGPHNSKCNLESAISNKPPVSSCEADSDCNFLQECSNHTCIFPQKQCTNSCGGRGKCIFQLVMSGRKLSKCAVNNGSCRSLCECSAGFFGSGCELDSAKLDEMRATQKSLISTLSVTRRYNEATPESLSAFVTSLSGLGENRRLLTIRSCTLLLAMVGDSTPQVAEIQLSSEVVAQLYTVMDSCGTVFADNVGVVLDGDDAFLESDWAYYHSILAALGEVISRDLVPGQSSDRMSELSRSSSAYSDDSTGNLAISIPSKPWERAVGIEKSSVESDGFSGVIEVEETAAKVHSNGSSFVSNPLRIRMATTKSALTSTNEFIVVLQNHEAVSYIPVNTTSSFEFITLCLPDDLTTYNHTCADSNVTLSHQCDGKYISLSSLCPIVGQRPSCSVISTDTAGTCIVQSFTTTKTVCRCNMTLKAGGRRLAVGEDSDDSTGTMSIATISQFVAEEFAATISDEVTVNDLKNSVTVIMVFGMFWALGIACVVYFYIDNTRVKSNLERGNAKTSPHQSGSEEDTSEHEKNTDARNAVQIYISETLPGIFRTYEHTWASLFWDIAERHSLYSLFFLSNDTPFHERVKTGLHLWTTQTYALFIAAVFLDLDVST